MRIQQRVTGYVSIVLLALSGIFLLIAGGAFLTAAARTDTRAAVIESERAQVAIEQRVLALSRNAVDWAAWDDTYAFAENLDPAYVEENLPPETMSNLDINLFAIYDTSGRLLYRMAYDLTSDEVVELPVSTNLISGNPRLNVASTSRGQTEGIVQLEDGRLLMTSSAAIVPTERNAPSRGSLVMARFLDEAEIESIERATQLHLTLTRDLSLLSESDDGVEILGNTVRVARPIKDATGETVAALVVEAARRAHRDALQSVAFIVASVFGIVAVATGVMHRGLNEIVLRKVSRLDQAVERIRTTGRPEPIEIEGDDELHTLSLNVGAMVEALEQARTEVEHRVEQRTAELRTALEDLRAETAQRLEEERKRLLSESRYRLLIDNIQDVVLTLTRDGEIKYASPSSRHVLGLAPEKLTGTSIEDIFEPESANLLLNWVGPGLAAGFVQLSLTAIRPDDEAMDVEAALMPLAGSEEVQVILRDVTARKRHESELLHMASHDFLTGLCNRRRFEEELARELAESQRRGSHGAILWIDLDNFKDVNDVLGHRAGDHLLIAIADRLGDIARAESLLARLGGDEFALLLPMADEKEAVAAAERFLGEVNEITLDIEGKTLRTTCSIGIVTYPEHGIDVEDLLARADMAMYRAKETGRSRYRVFDQGEEWRGEIEDRRTWVELVEMALDQDMLAAYAQPITDLVSGEIAGFELLVRIIDFEGTPIPPQHFLPVAERVGLIVDIDLWVLGEAVRLLEEHSDESFRLNVNVSPRTFGDARFLGEFDRLLRERNFDRQRLGIEITETAIVLDVVGTRDALRHVKNLGCRIALDDFGSGFTSFLHLKQLPIDDVKIDGSFVTTLCESLNDQHLVRAMVEMAHGLNMRTTAEFVESTAILDMLRSFGVDMAQGFAIGRPEPVQNFIASVEDVS